MMNNPSTVGYTANTPQHLMLNTGAIYLNYGLPAESLLGAVATGNEFDCTVKSYDIKLGGVTASKLKGLEFITDVTASLKVNMLEVTTAILQAAIQGSVVDTSNSNYDIISLPLVLGNGNQTTIKNIALVTTISGSLTPVVILLFNAMSTGGIKIKLEDGKDNIIPLTFEAFLDPLFPNASLFEIHNPKMLGLLNFTLITAPVIDNAKILMQFSDVVEATVPLQGFTVMVAGVANIVTSAVKSLDMPNSILLTLTTPTTSGQAVTVAYTQPVIVANQVTSLSGVALNTFIPQTVINN